jgi:uncharacterized protein
MFKHIIYLFVIIFLITAYFRYIESRSLFLPAKDIGLTPDVYNLSYEDVYFKTNDGETLNGWFIFSNVIPAKAEIRKKTDPRFYGDDKKRGSSTFLFYHGNGGNISHRLDKINMLCRSGINVFVFDYRGYGKSTGVPSEKGLYKDAEAAFDYLVSEKHVSPDRVILYGESLGGAVAVNEAVKNKAGALITESAFSSVRDVAKSVYPFLPRFVFSSRFDSAVRIGRVKIPKLIIHSKDDEIVKFEQSLKLFNLSKEPKKHLILRGGHNTCYMDSKDLYVDGIRGFVKDFLK